MWISKKYFRTEETRNKRKKVGNQLKFKILKRDGYRCQMCGKTSDDGVKLQVDHMTPLTLGGDNSEDNLWVLCSVCNSGKSMQTLHDSTEDGKIMEELNKDD